MAVCIPSPRQAIVALAMCAAVIGAAPAQARVFVGIGIPFYGPGFYPPPAYYPPPPVYYAPPPPVVYAPPQVYAPPPQASAPYGARQACYAGPYVCPMDHPAAIGANCYCPGNGGQRVWGRTN